MLVGVRGVLVLLLAACGPGLKGPPAVTAQQSFAEGAQDATRIREMLSGYVTNGGLWFDDAQCTAEFGVPGEVKEAQLEKFAQCLAGLKLQPSARKDSLGDVTVLNYGAGFEVEARVINEFTGPRLTWIGFSVGDGNAIPTITGDALEALRTAGDRNGPLDPRLAQLLVLDPMPTSRAEFAWLKVCLDETGNVLSIRSFESTSTTAYKVFLDAASSWRFKPFTIAGQPVPVCAMVRPTYPVGQGPEVETLPLPLSPSKRRDGTVRDPVVLTPGTKMLEGHRIAGKKSIVPDDQTKTAIAQSGASRFMGVFRICIDEAGHVESVLPLVSTGFATYDRDLRLGMMKWVYKPYTIDDQPVPVCTKVTFIYSQK
jgi:hypothetical protein